MKSRPALWTAIGAVGGIPMAVALRELDGGAAPGAWLVAPGHQVDERLLPDGGARRSAIAQSGGPVFEDEDAAGAEPWEEQVERGAVGPRRWEASRAAKGAFAAWSMGHAFLTYFFGCAVAYGGLATVYGMTERSLVE